MINKRSFSDIVLSESMVSQQQLDDANEYKKKHNVRMGEALVYLGYITEAEKLKLLSKQLKMPIFSGEEIDNDETLLGMFTKDYIKRNRFIPYKKTDISLQIIVADTFNLPLEDELNKRFKLPVEYLLVSDKQIDSWIYSNVQQEDLTSKLEKIRGDKLLQDTIDISNMDGDTPVVINAVNQIIEDALSQGASDIHIMPAEDYVQVRYRIDGILHKMKSLPIESSSAIVSRIKTMTGTMDISDKRKPQDGKISIRNGKGGLVDLRISTLPSVYGEKVTIRILDKSAMKLEINNLSLLEDTKEKFMKIISNPVGILLITGPTGSGKSTTMSTVISELNDISRNIITVEDPVEYQIEGITQVQVSSSNLETNVAMTFATALKSILRQDPDIILVGEVRDNETAAMAVQAANTGHFVVSTLHTNDAASALTRLINMDVEPYMIADSLIAVLNQRLVRKLCGHCKEPHILPEDSRYRKLFGIDKDEVVEIYKEHDGGCKHCRNVGFMGRIPLHELLYIDDDIKLLLSHNISPFELKQKAIQNGMRTLKLDGYEKIKLGLTTFEEVQRLVTLE